MHLPHSAARRGLFLGVYLLFLCGLCWAGARLFWNLHAGVPLNETVQIWDYQYPELRISGALTAQPQPGDAAFDVVILGASTVDGEYGAGIEAGLQAGLEQRLRRPVRIYNLATAAHTSRDSMLKFSRLAGKPFDLVLVYDGFNDLRMNNCPREQFQADYTHCSWYRSFEKRLKLGRVSLPAVLFDSLETMHETVLLGPPEGDRTEHGGEIKTAEPFRANLENILTQARKDGTAVVLMTFAFRIPADYSEERFAAGESSYAREPRQATACPVSMWGETPHIITGIEKHNDVLRALAAAHSEAIFVDQASLIPPDGSLFIDPCHFSRAGQQRFVENLLPVLAARFASPPR